MISIHAPRAGRDKAAALRAGDIENFNPRAPCGARPYACRWIKNER